MKEGDKATPTCSDSVEHSVTFQNFLHPRHLIRDSSDLSPATLLLMRGYVTFDLYNIFWQHISTSKLRNTLMFTFLQHAMELLKASLWKHRALAWKQWKHDRNICKQDFIKYRSTFAARNRTSMLMILLPCLHVTANLHLRSSTFAQN